MKLNSTIKTFESNNEGESTNFGIGDVGMVIEILRNKLYSHPIRTLVQEYISNARDANREVSSTKRIKVTTPTHLSPEFRVRDFGPGISPERMQKVFVLYGASTKRDTNKQVGGFGIGAKSAWSYTDSFTITTFIDGTRRDYIAHIGSSQNGSLDLLNESVTDEDNGTEIKLAINLNDLTSFRRAIERATFFWSDEEKPEWTHDTKYDFSNQITLDNVLIVDTQLEFLENERSFLVIDGIPYASSHLFNGEWDKLSGLLSYHSKCYFKIPTGLVEIGANREQVSDTKNTKSVIKMLSLKLEKAVKESIQKQHDEIVTIKDYISTELVSSTLFTGKFEKELGDYEIKYYGEIKSKLFQKIKETGVKINLNSKTLTYDKVNRFNQMTKDNLSSFIFDDMLNESKQKRACKIRGAFEVLNPISKWSRKAYTPELVLLSNGTIVDVKCSSGTYESTLVSLTDIELNKMLDDLGIPRLSSFDDGEKTIRKSKGSVKTKGGIVVWGYNAESIDLSSNTKQYVYMDLTEKDTQLNFRELVSDLTGKQLIRIGKTYMKDIEGDTNFQKFEDFQAEYFNNEDLAQGLINHTIKESKLSLLDVKAEIKIQISNKYFNDVLGLYQAIHFDVYFRSNAETITWVSSFKGMDKTIKKIIVNCDILKTKYSLALSELTSSYQIESELEQAIWFMNNRK